MTTGTTLSGIPYTQTDSVLPNGQDVRVTIPDHRAAGTDVPLLLSCHGNNGNYTSLSGNTWGTLLDTVLGHGMAVVQATAGVASGDNGGNNYANDHGITTYRQALTYAETLLDVGSLLPHGSSAGGMMASWAAVRDDVLAPRSVGLVLSRGVVNAYVWRAGNNGGSNIPPDPYDPEWHKLQSGVFVAPYGLADGTQATYDASIVPTRDPLLFSDADWLAAGPVHSHVGSVDDVVPPFWHGQALHNRLATLGIDSTLVVTTGAHEVRYPVADSEAVEFAAFLTRTVGAAVPYIDDDDEPVVPAPFFAPDIYIRRAGSTRRVVDATLFTGGVHRRLKSLAVTTPSNRAGIPAVRLVTTSTPPS